jgi:hypothetical protein
MDFGYILRSGKHTGKQMTVSAQCVCHPMSPNAKHLYRILYCTRWIGPFGYAIRHGAGSAGSRPAILDRALLLW